MILKHIDFKIFLVVILNKISEWHDEDNSSFNYHTLQMTNGNEDYQFNKWLFEGYVTFRRLDSLINLEKHFLVAVMDV